MTCGNRTPGPSPGEQIGVALNGQVPGGPGPPVVEVVENEAEVAHDLDKIPAHDAPLPVHVYVAPGASEPLRYFVVTLEPADNALAVGIADILEVPVQPVFDEADGLLGPDPILIPDDKVAHLARVERQELIPVG